jgi:hypothetical protein
LITGTAPLGCISWTLHVASRLGRGNVVSSNGISIPAFTTIFNTPVLCVYARGGAGTKLKGHAVVGVEVDESSTADIVSIASQ